MSISLTLANALTGLSASSRSAQVVSNNVANATTEGYARREIQLSARGTGGVGSGVRVDGVVRIVDETLLREVRLSSASNAEAGEAADFFKSALDALGEPQDPSSLNGRLAELDRALLAATSRPESDARLNDVLNAAQGLAGKLNAASDTVQGLRQDADRSIGREVERLNTSLAQIAELNSQILRARGTDQDYPSLLDSRQKLVDDISGLVPVRVLERENDTIALYTMNGALLMDAKPATFAFEPSALITPDMTLGSGALSGLTLDGRSLATSGEFSPIAGGHLAGLFKTRDDLAPAVQDDLDAFARDLINRFQDPAPDPSLAATDPGIFTDGGSALDALNVIGLSGRISVNAQVDPAQGGEVWRLRDGLGAAAPGAVGDPALLDALQVRLNEMRAPIGGSLSSTDRTAQTFAADLVSLIGQSLTTANAEKSFQNARYEGLQQAILSNGVDTDQELQKLLLIEQSFAANARVIQTADELIQLLIGL
jgi:flagellar hook-associated protein 1 FlgK